MPEPASRLVPADLVRRQTAAILGAWGAPARDVEIVAARMHESDLRGIDSHGVGMFPTYDALRRAGAINLQPDVRVVRDDGPTGLVDGDHGLGHLAATRAMTLAAGKAREHGVGMVAVRRSNHYGAAGVYASLAAEQGLIGFSTTGTSQRSVVPTFGREPRFSTNPLAFAAPARRNPPFLLDMATSTVALGKMNIARRAGRALPAGWALDAAGRPEHDAEQAYAAAPRRLTPLGGSRELGSHKGYGLAMMVEILSSVLTGSFIGGRDPETWEPGPYRNIGHFMMAIDPSRFSEDGAFDARLDGLIDMLHATPPAEGAEAVLVAGEPEHRETARRAESGIPMLPKLVEELRAVAGACGADWLLG